MNQNKVGPRLCFLPSVTHSVEILIFLNESYVTPCSFLAGHRRFVAYFCFLVLPSRCRQQVRPKRWYSFIKTTRRHIPDEYIPDAQRRENVKSHISLV
jgi:hypothetical protein